MHIDPHSHHSVVIVGGGFAGALTAIKLLDKTEVPLSITILEPREELGRGVAYSTAEAVHLVNGPAGTFSLHPEEPDHLTHWLAENALRYGWTPPADIAGSFPPRHLYGTYVRDELRRAISTARSGSTFRHVRAAASSLASAPHRVEITTSEGAAIEADEVVLALGVFRPDLARQEASIARHPGFAASPWDAAALDRLVETDEILLIGSSLSMVDAVASMEARGFQRIRAMPHWSVISSRRDRCRPPRGPCSRLSRPSVAHWRRRPRIGRRCRSPSVLTFCRCGKRLTIPRDCGLPVTCGHSGT